MNLSERAVQSLLTVAQVAKRLNCSTKTVYKLIDNGTLSHYRCPGVRVSEEQLSAYLEQSKCERGRPEPPRPKLPRPRFRHITLR